MTKVVCSPVEKPNRICSINLVSARSTSNLVLKQDTFGPKSAAEYNCAGISYEERNVFKKSWSIRKCNSLYEWVKTFLTYNGQG